MAGKATRGTADQTIMFDSCTLFTVLAVEVSLQRRLYLDVREDRDDRRRGGLVLDHGAGIVWLCDLACSAADVIDRTADSFYAISHWEEKLHECS